MPFRPRRKQYRKRGPRKMAARRPYVARNRRINTKGVHYFKRSFYVSSDLLSTGGVSLNFAKSYNLNQLPVQRNFQIYSISIVLILLRFVGCLVLILLSYLLIILLVHCFLL